jgi:hypothetical protein
MALNQDDSYDEGFVDGLPTQGGPGIQAPQAGLDRLSDVQRRIAAANGAGAGPQPDEIDPAFVDSLPSQAPPTRQPDADAPMALGSAQPPAPATEMQVQPPIEGEIRKKEEPYGPGKGLRGVDADMVKQTEAIRQANEANAPVQEAAARREAEMRERQAADAEAKRQSDERVNAEAQSRTDAHLQEFDRLQHGLRQMKVDPGRLWSSATSGQRTRMVFGSILAGMGGDPDVLTRMIDKDVAQQKWDYEKAKGEVQEAKDAYSYFRQNGLDRQASQSAAGVAIASAWEMKYKAAASRQASDTARNNLLAASAEMKLKTDQELEKLRQHVAELSMQGAQLAETRRKNSMDYSMDKEKLRLQEEALGLKADKGGPEMVTGAGGEPIAAIPPGVEKAEAKKVQDSWQAYLQADEKLRQLAESHQRFGYEPGDHWFQVGSQEHENRKRLTNEGVFSVNDFYSKVGIKKFDAETIRGILGNEGGKLRIPGMGTVGADPAAAIEKVRQDMRRDMETRFDTVGLPGP